MNTRPLTRKELIQELDELCPLYCHSGQEKNIIAAKEYHSQFPADQIAPATLILFVEGRQVDENDPDISMPPGMSWYEGVEVFLADVPTQVSVTDLPFEFPGGNRRSESGLYVKELAYVVS